jgi:type II secretion system protein G
MLGFIYKKLNNRKGFSLIELVVVVAILGILAAVAIPRVTGSLEKAKINTDKANLRIINNAIELYNAEKGSYPSETLTTFKTDMSTYLPTIPTIQVTGYHFIYDKDSAGDKVIYTITGEASGNVELK